MQQRCRSHRFTLLSPPRATTALFQIAGVRSFTSGHVPCDIRRRDCFSSTENLAEALWVLATLNNTEVERTSKRKGEDDRGAEQRRWDSRVTWRSPECGDCIRMEAANAGVSPMFEIQPTCSRAHRGRKEGYRKDRVK